MSSLGRFHRRHMTHSLALFALIWMHFSYAYKHLFPGHHRLRFTEQFGISGHRSPRDFASFPNCSWVIMLSINSKYTNH